MNSGSLQQRKEGFMREIQEENGLFSISLAGLSTGTHTFAFDIDQKLIELFENEEIHGAKLKAEVSLIMRPNVTETLINITGKVVLMCDRCLGLFDYQLNLDETAIVKQIDKMPDNEINIIIFDPAKGRIKLDQYFYDMIMTSLPMQRTHEQEKDCDPKMLKRIEEEEENHSDGIDPRWNDLKNLI